MEIEVIADQIKRKLFDLEDRMFERRYGLELGGIVPQAQLVSKNIDALPHATAYHAVWCRNLRVLLAEARRTGIALDHFVDIGAGKGKACFYAAGDAAFERIVGVEFSGPLVQIARANQHRFPDRDITFIEGDARTYTLPDAPSLVFMFNPFDAVVMTAFLEHNLAHFRRHPSLVAYANDTQLKTLAGFGFHTVFRDQVRRISLHLL